MKKSELNDKLLMEIQNWTKGSKKTGGMNEEEVAEKEYLHEKARGQMERKLSGKQATHQEAKERERI